MSGLALGKAVTSLGGRAVVFDQKPNDNPGVMRAVDALDAAGIDAVTGWHGRLDPDEFDLLAVSPGFPREHPAIRDMLTAGREVWSEVEFASRIARAPILGITGTNGKSTTTVMLWSLLVGSGRRAVLCGNIAGSGYPERTLTEAALNADQDDVLVAEISSYQLEWTSHFRPRVATVTNVTPDHMDRYKSFDDYFQTKLRLFAAMGDGDSVVANLDEPSLPEPVIQAAVPAGVRTVGFSPSGGRQGSGHTFRDGDRLRFSGFDAHLDDLPLFGEHNVTNAMAAWEMAASVTEPDEGTFEALRAFKGLANRMERLGDRDGVTLVNNSMCTNPAAVVASCRSLKGRLHILMGGVTKNLDFAPVGDYLRSTPHRVCLFGPDPDKMNAMLGSSWPHYPDMERAFEAAVGQAATGDTVILAPGCASAEPYANFKERGDAFRTMARDWLHKVQA